MSEYSWIALSLRFLASSHTDECRMLFSHLSFLFLLETQCFSCMLCLTFDGKREVPLLHSEKKKLLQFKKWYYFLMMKSSEKKIKEKKKRASSVWIRRRPCLLQKKNLYFNCDCWKLCNMLLSAADIDAELSCMTLVFHTSHTSSF